MIYEGSWQNDAPHGNGTLYIPFMQTGEGANNENIFIEGIFN